MNVANPIKRRMKLKRDSSNRNWINFKYERLPSFCFVCRIIGHSERDCGVVYANPEKIVDHAYGTWLRASTRSTKVGACARWLRNANAGENEGDKNNDRSGPSNTTHDGGEADARFMEVDGVFREIHGDQEAVRIVTRDKGDNENLKTIHNQGDMTDKGNLKLLFNNI